MEKKNKSNTLFIKGIISLYMGKLRYADTFFFKALTYVDGFSSDYQKILSYHGLTQILSQKKSGIQNCYFNKEALDSEVLINRAWAELLVENRKRSVTAAKQIPHNHTNNKILDIYYNVTGKRSKDSKGNYLRNNLINRAFGKVKRKRNTISSQKIIEQINQQLFILYKEDIKGF
ncbi:MAG: hypothetical protein GY694_19240 [Gammaproteobacteria bacterium]|nr:hypothetical protein [Gammaproteobacteria bacterium]